MRDLWVESIPPMAHIKPWTRGGDPNIENMMILCPTCHSAVDSANLSPEFLLKIKHDWVGKATLGKSAVVDVAKFGTVDAATGEESIGFVASRIIEFRKWAEALKRVMTLTNTYKAFQIQLQVSIQKINLLMIFRVLCLLLWGLKA